MLSPQANIHNLIRFVKECTKRLVTSYIPYCTVTPHKNMAQARDILDCSSNCNGCYENYRGKNFRQHVRCFSLFQGHVFNVPLGADSQTIAQHREQFVNENLHRANVRHWQYDYTPKQQVLKKVHNPTKLGVRTTSPFAILHVRVNGNITLQLCPGVTERINIRRVIPYRTTPTTNPTWGPFTAQRYLVFFKFFLF